MNSAVEHLHNDIVGSHESKGGVNFLHWPLAEYRVNLDGSLPANLIYNFTNYTIEYDIRLYPFKNH